MDAILLLAGVGFLLLLTEMFLPGGVLGALGCALLVAAIVVGYVQHGFVWGSVMLCVIVVVVLVGFCVWMAIFPRTAVGRSLMLGRSLGKGDERAPSLCAVGDVGISITPLRPAGTARIGERRVDVVAEGEFVERDAAITVIACEGARIVVRKKA